MESQPTPGTYAAVDPFKPSISFSIKKILGSQRAPQDDTNLNSPPPRVAIPTRRHGTIRPPMAMPPSEAPPDWVTTASSRIRLPPAHELRAPRSELPPDNWIPQASDLPSRLPLPHDFQHVQEDSQSHWSSRPPAARMNTTSTNSRQHNISHQNSEFQSRGRSRSSSLSSRPDEPLRQKKKFRSRHQSRSPSPSVERNRERSPSQRSRSRSRSPVRSRRSRRSTRRSRSSSMARRSDARAPMVLIPESSSKSNSAAPRLVRTERSNERPPPIITLPPSGVLELAPLPSSLPSPIIIQPSSLRSSSDSQRSRSTRARSKIPPIISPYPALIPIEPCPLSTESGDEYRLPISPAGNSTSQPPLPGPSFPTPYPSLPPIHSIPYPIAEAETATSPSVSSRRGAVNLVSAPFDEKRPVGLLDSSESVHLMTYVAAFALDTLPRQLYLHFLLRLPYMYFSRVTRIFEEAEMSMPQIKQGILEAAIQLKEPVKDVADAWELEPVESAQYSKLQNTWQSFIDSLMREWKTLNIISVLLLS